MEENNKLLGKIKELQAALENEKKLKDSLLRELDQIREEKNKYDKKINDIQTELVNKNKFIENLNSQIRNQLQITTFLNEITKVAISRGNLKNTLSAITEGITSTMKVKKISVYFFNTDKTSFVLSGEKNMPEAKQEIHPEDLMTTPLKEVVFYQKELLVNLSELNMAAKIDIMAFPLIDNYKKTDLNTAKIPADFFDKKNKDEVKEALKELYEKGNLNIFGIMLAGFDDYENPPDLKSVEDFSPVVNQSAIILNSAIINERVKEQAKIITRQYNRIEKELELSRQVQMSILPKTIPVHKNMNIAVKFIPTGYVGGDFFDIIKIDENKIGILIADVSGHGVPAAFMATISKIIFNNCAYLYDSPKEIIKELNRNLYENFKLEHYLTLFFGIFNAHTGEFVYTKAGHPPALHFSQKGINYLETEGLFVGPFEDGIFEEKRITLSKGDSLFLYTDGIIEGANKNFEEYGLKRTINQIEKNIKKEVSLNSILNDLIKDYKKFTEAEEEDDDITAVLIKYSSSVRKNNIIISSSLNEIKKVIEQIFSDLAHFDFSYQTVEELRLIFEEALTNAVLHGNKNETQKKVFTDYEIDNEKIKVIIKDDGSGFKHNAIPDPRTGQNLKNPSGRGVFLIKTLADEVFFNQKGNELTITKFNRKKIDFN